MSLYKTIVKDMQSIGHRVTIQNALKTKHVTGLDLYIWFRIVREKGADADNIPQFSFSMEGIWVTNAKRSSFLVSLAMYRHSVEDILMSICDRGYKLVVALFLNDILSPDWKYIVNKHSEEVNHDAIKQTFYSCTMCEYECEYE